MAPPRVQRANAHQTASNATAATPLSASSKRHTLRSHFFFTLALSTEARLSVAHCTTTHDQPAHHQRGRCLRSFTLYPSPHSRIKPQACTSRISLRSVGVGCRESGLHVVCRTLRFCLCLPSESLRASGFRSAIRATHRQHGTCGLLHPNRVVSSVRPAGCPALANLQCGRPSHTTVGSHIMQGSLDGHIAAARPDLISLLAVPPPLEHIPPRPKARRDLKLIHHLEIWEQQAAIGEARAAAGTLRHGVWPRSFWPDEVGVGLAELGFLTHGVEAGSFSLPQPGWDRVARPGGSGRHGAHQHPRGVECELRGSVATPAQD
jgi:hypothetical protein